MWAVLIARIYEVFPLVCPKCGGQMRLIAFAWGFAKTVTQTRRRVAMRPAYLAKR